MGRKPKLWSKKVGGYGYTVHVYEREPDGTLYIRRYDLKTGNWIARSLKHQDRERAEEQADEVAGEILSRRRERTEGKVTLRRLFREYLASETPNKNPKEQKADHRRVKMWTQVLGAAPDPLSAKNWKARLDGFVRDRRAGKLKGLGAVGGRTVQADLVFLQSVFNWASGVMGPQLMDRNPIRGYRNDAARELNPHRPRAAESRYERVSRKVGQSSLPSTPCCTSSAGGPAGSAGSRSPTSTSTGASSGHTAG